MNRRISAVGRVEVSLERSIIGSPWFTTLEQIPRAVILALPEPDGSAQSSNRHELTEPHFPTRSGRLDDRFGDPQTLDRIGNRRDRRRFPAGDHLEEVLVLSSQGATDHAIDHWPVAEIRMLGCFVRPNFKTGFQDTQAGTALLADDFD